MRSPLGLFGIIALVLVPVMAEDGPCTARDGDNYYDLSSLSANKDYEFDSRTGVKFVINVCKPFYRRGGHSKLTGPKMSVDCTARTYANTSLAVLNGNPVSIMTGGSECASAQGTYASSAIRFVCDTSVFGAAGTGCTTTTGDNDACAFFLEWRTHVACPTHEKTGAVGFVTVVLAILGTLFMLYILVGTFYNRYVLELRGFDQIPRVSFGGILESVSGCVDRVKPARGTPGRGGRQTDGRTSRLLDEQDEEEPTAEEQSTKPAGMGADGPRPTMDPHHQQPMDEPQNFLPPAYPMYASEDDQYLVYQQHQMPYNQVVHPGPPPRQMSDSDLQQAIQYQHTSADGIYHHSRHSSATGSPSSSRANSLVHRHPLRYNPTPSPTSSSAGRRSRGRSISDDDDGMGVGMAESLANTRKEATRRQRIEAEQRRRDELRDGYARLKEVLPVSNQKSSKVSLLERACNHIVSLEKSNRQLQSRLAQVEVEVVRLRTLNEKISLGVNVDARPLSPPPEESQQHQLTSVAGQQPPEESSPSASEGGF
ncbi:uncharacterized protein B0H18DRAFT_1084052 [Fomitopsis serialis]|uniref:uncharacterized protein n=1 Tax=Fomitopsis serialis TaxID=139415 RepID=UPI0020081967|nr:uncharacterized protein B0H18DRAFT_1084052 [Neoantrodia serialis]KAH9929695.1 hypothetical protein B0H18DRAFT_1084052 [Neoantrodia serialis]